MSITLMIMNVILFLAVLLMFYIVAYAMPKKQSLVTQLIGLLAALSTVYILGYLIEINTNTIEGKLFWNYVQYLSIPFLPGIWLLIAFTHAKNHLIKRKYIVMIYIVPIVTFIMRYTNNFHHLFYRSYDLVETPYFKALHINVGPIYYIQFIYVTSIIFFTNYLYFKAYKEITYIPKKTTLRLFLISIFPLFGIIANITLVNYVPIDFAALLFPVSIVLIIFALKDEYFISIKPFARNEIFLHAEDAIIVLDNKGNIIDNNVKAKKVFSKFDTLFNKAFSELKHAYMHFPVISDDNAYGYFEEDNVTYQVKRSAIKNSHQVKLGSLVTLTDVTENMTALKTLKQNEERIKYLLYHDQLTDLYNRHYLDNFLMNLSNKDHPMPMIFIDMNELKAVNDYFGHQMGDKVLIKLAKIIQSHCSEKDIAIRLGGDEFLVLMPNKTDEEATDFIVNLKTETDNEKHVSIAIGYAVKEFNDDFEYVYKLAEDRMYANKTQYKKK